MAINDATTTTEARSMARAMVPSIRQLGPSIVIAGVLPFVGYALLRPHVSSDAVALVAISVFPIGNTVFQWVSHGRLDPIGVIATIGIGAGLIGAVLLRGDPTLLKLRESVITGLFGLTCVCSLTARRPVMFYMGRYFATAGDKEKFAEFEAIWELPGVPWRFRFVTAVWGLALMGEAGARTGLALTVSTQRFLAMAPVMGWAVLGGLLWFTTAFVRSGERRVAALVDQGGLAGTSGD